jgi:hypothetical protein
MVAAIDEVATDGADDVLSEAAAVHLRTEEEIETRVPVLPMGFLVGLDVTDHVAFELDDPARLVLLVQFGPDIVGLPWLPPTRDLGQRVHRDDVGNVGLAQRT